MTSTEYKQTDSDVDQTREEQAPRSSSKMYALGESEDCDKNSGWLNSFTEKV